MIGERASVLPNMDLKLSARVVGGRIAFVTLLVCAAA